MGGRGSGQSAKRMEISRRCSADMGNRQCMSFDTRPDRRSLSRGRDTKMSNMAIQTQPTYVCALRFHDKFFFATSRKKETIQKIDWIFSPNFYGFRFGVGGGREFIMVILRMSVVIIIIESLTSHSHLNLRTLIAFGDIDFSKTTALQSLMIHALRGIDGYVRYVRSC